MAEREAILGKAACLQGCCRTVEANTPPGVASCPSPKERLHHLLNPFCKWC